MCTSSMGAVAEQLHTKSRAKTLIGPPLRAHTHARTHARGAAETSFKVGIQEHKKT